MANTGFKGIDVRQTGIALVFRAALKASDGSKVTSGTTTLALYELQSDGTLKSYDFNDNTFKTTSLTTGTASMTHRQGNNSTVNTGVWTYALSTLTGFTVGSVYLCQINNSGASPVDQEREFQYGGEQGDLAITANGTGVGYIQGDAKFVGGQTANAAAAVTFPALIASTTNLAAGTIASVSGNIGGSLIGNIQGNLAGNVGGSVAGTVASVTGNIGGSVLGNVSGTVGSISGVTFPTSFSSLVINSRGSLTVSRWDNGTSFAAVLLDATNTYPVGTVSGLTPSLVATIANQTTILNAVNGITTNTARSAPRVPDFMARPASSNVVYTGDLYLYTLQGTLEDADANTVTVHARNSAGTSRDSGLSSTTMTRISAGFYRLTYTANSTDTAEAVYFDFTWTVGSVAMKDGAATEVQDAENYAFLAAIKAKTDFLPSATAGAAGGLFIAGTNAATSITGALTTSFAGTLTTVTNLTNAANGSSIVGFGYLGDYDLAAQVTIVPFATFAASGLAATYTGGTIKIYKDNSATERTSSSGITLTKDFDGVTGTHILRITFSDDTDPGFFAAGQDYTVVLSGATIAGQVLSGPIARFSLQQRSIGTLFGVSIQATASGIPVVAVGGTIGDPNGDPYSANDMTLLPVTNFADANGRPIVATSSYYDPSNSLSYPVQFSSTHMISPGISDGLPKASVTADVTVDFSQVLTQVIEPGFTLQDVLKVALATLGSKSSGGGTSTVKFRNAGDTVDRITATVDQSKNRLTLVYDLS